MRSGQAGRIAQQATDQAVHFNFDHAPLERLAAGVVRAVFLTIFITAVAYVSYPQSETFWTAHETLGDAARLTLGIVICVLLAVRIFIIPKDPESYRGWLYVGLGAVPIALVCLLVFR